MKTVKKKMSPWLRACVVTAILNPDRETAARKLGISREALNQELWHVYKILNVPTPIRAAVKLGLVQINYDLLPDWLEVDDVMMTKGMTLKIDAPLRQPEDQWVTFGKPPTT